MTGLPREPRRRARNRAAAGDRRPTGRSSRMTSDIDEADRSRMATPEPGPGEQARPLASPSGRPSPSSPRPRSSSGSGSSTRRCARSYAASTSQSGDGFAGMDNYRPSSPTRASGHRAEEQRDLGGVRRRRGRDGTRPDIRGADRTGALGYGGVQASSSSCRWRSRCWRRTSSSTGVDEEESGGRGGERVWVGGVARHVLPGVGVPEGPPGGRESPLEARAGRGRVHHQVARPRGRETVSLPLVGVAPDLMPDGAREAAVAGRSPDRSRDLARPDLAGLHTGQGRGHAQQGRRGPNWGLRRYEGRGAVKDGRVVGVGDGGRERRHLHAAGLGRRGAPTAASGGSNSRTVQRPGLARPVPGHPVDHHRLVHLDVGGLRDGADRGPGWRRSRELLEAARVDGASEWQVFRRVTVPLLGAGPFAVVTVTLMINVLKVFDLVFIYRPRLLPGRRERPGPGAVPQGLLRKGQQPGIASAISVFLLLLVIPVMWFNVRRLRREGSGGDERRSSRVGVPARPGGGVSGGLVRVCSSSVGYRPVLAGADDRSAAVPVSARRRTSRRAGLVEGVHGAVADHLEQLPRSCWENDDITSSLLKTRWWITVPATLLVVIKSAPWRAMPSPGWSSRAGTGGSWGVVGLLVVPVQVALIPIGPNSSATSASSARCSAVVFFHVGFGLPFAVFLLRNFFGGDPERAAGGGTAGRGGWELRLFFRVVSLPLGAAGDRRPRHLPVPVGVERPAGRADLLGLREPADHGRAPDGRYGSSGNNIDVLAPGCVHLDGGPAGRLLRVPAAVRVRR